MTKSIHVTPNQGGGWRVVGEGNTRASIITDTQKEAIEYSVIHAKKYNEEVVIHGRDGKIRDKDSYGNDPIPPRDRVM